MILGRHDGWELQPENLRNLKHFSNKHDTGPEKVILHPTPPSRQSSITLTEGGGYHRRRMPRTMQGSTELRERAQHGRNSALPHPSMVSMRNSGRTRELCFSLSGPLSPSGPPVFSPWCLQRSTAEVSSRAAECPIRKKKEKLLDRLTFFTFFLPPSTFPSSSPKCRIRCPVERCFRI